MGEVLDWLGEEEEAAWLWEVEEEAEAAGLKVVELPCWLERLTVLAVKEEEEEEKGVVLAEWAEHLLPPRQLTPFAYPQEHEGT